MLKKLAAAFTAFLLTLLPLATAATASALSSNPVANPQASTSELDTNSNRTEPTNWDFGSWTSTTGADAPVATPQYVTNDGHGDSTSMKVTMANYDTTYVAGADGNGLGGALSGDDGDAKWIFDPLTVGTGANQLQAGKQYAFSMWYKTDLTGSFTPKVVVDYIAADGTESFYGMSNPEPSADAATTWNHYSNSFYVPSTAAKVTVFMYIDHNGWIQTDDYSLTDYTPTGFNQALLTLTFDDGQEDNVANALPLIQQYGLKTTQCFETQTLINEPSQVTSNVMAFANAGQEICSHTITHPMLTQVDDTQLTKELTESKSYLEQQLAANGASQTVVSDFASPYGDYNKKVNDAVKAAGYASHRTVDEGFNSKDNYDPYRLRVQNVFNTTTAAEVAAWVQQAQADNTWLILVYHRVTSTAAEAGQYDTDKATFATQLEAIKNSGIKVEAFSDALAETKAQVGATADTTAPTVSATADASTQPVKVTWSANETVASSKVEYGTTTAYGSTATTTVSGGSNVATLPTLAASTKYYYRVSATDAAGNTGTYAGEFTTPAGTANPAISSVSTGTPTSTSAQVTWTTDQLTTTKFEYGTTTAYGTVKNDAVTATSHTQSLTGLTPNTTYHFKVTATTLGGQAVTYTGQFKTAASSPTTVGDITGDGKVNDDDATILFANWGNNPTAGDINNDGVVNDDDATLLFANWSK